MQAYTFNLEDKLVNEFDSANQNMNFESFKNLFLKNPENPEFRSFGDAIVAEMVEKTSLQIPDQGWEKFKEMAKNAKINLEELGIRSTTWNGWFKGKELESNDNGRKKVFAIAFALGLNEDEAKTFIRKTCFRRPFDPGNIIDCVCYYCIKNEKNWPVVEDLLKQIEERKKTQPYKKSQPPCSRSLEMAFGKIENDNDLIQYCSILSETRHRLEEKVKDMLSGQSESNVKSIRELAKEEKQEYEGKLNAIINVFFPGCNIIGKSNETSFESPQSIINWIVGYNIGRGKEDSISGMMEGITKRITENFPSGNNQPNMECLRKTCILLYSYQYWRYWRSQFESQDLILKPERWKDAQQWYYMEAMNKILAECGVQELYFGDPFDALMLCCAYPYRSNPIDNFRQVMDILHDDSKRKRKEITPNGKVFESNDDNQDIEEDETDANEGNANKLELENKYLTLEERNKLVESYYEDIEKLSKKFYRKNKYKCRLQGYVEKDLVQMGNQVAIKYIPSYDPSHVSENGQSVELITYLTKCINEEFNNLLFRGVLGKKALGKDEIFCEYLGKNKLFPPQTLVEEFVKKWGSFCEGKEFTSFLESFLEKYNISKNEQAGIKEDFIDKYKSGRKTPLEAMKESFKAHRQDENRLTEESFYGNWKNVFLDSLPENLLPQNKEALKELSIYLKGEKKIKKPAEAFENIIKECMKKDAKQLWKEIKDLYSSTAGLEDYMRNSPIDADAPLDKFFEKYGIYTQKNIQGEKAKNYCVYVWKDIWKENRDQFRQISLDTPANSDSENGDDLIDFMVCPESDPADIVLSNESSEKNAKAKTSVIKHLPDLDKKIISCIDEKGCKSSDEICLRIKKDEGVVVDENDIILTMSRFCRLLKYVKSEEIKKDV